MFPNPDQLAELSPAQILESAAAGHLGLDHCFLRSLLDRPAETVPALISFSKRDRSKDIVDLEGDLLALLRVLRVPEAIPFYIDLIRVLPEDIPDELVEALYEQREQALEPLLKLSQELDESESGEVAFLLASLRLRDPRILEVLLDRLEFDAADGAFLLGLYGDPAARQRLVELLTEVEGDANLKKELEEALAAIESPASHQTEEPSSFDIWDLYPEEADLPVDLLTEAEKVELLDHSSASVRAAVAAAFFNQQPVEPIVKKLLAVALNDADSTTRARAWEALMDAAEKPEVVDAMLRVMRNPQTPLEERAGVLVGLSLETDRNEVRAAIEKLYQEPDGRAKALEAMWRSLHPSFRDRFAKHLDDPDFEVRRNAVWGVGYYGIRSELEKIRSFFTDDDLRAEAIFAYTLALPTDLSRGRMKGLFRRVEEAASGLSEQEEHLVKAALDERLALAGKPAFFAAEKTE